MILALGRGTCPGGCNTIGHGLGTSDESLYYK